MKDFPEELKKAEKLDELLRTGKRNEIVRKQALVSYRCDRGCLLGALFRIGRFGVVLSMRHVGQRVVFKADWEREAEKDGLDLRWPWMKQAGYEVLPEGRLTGASWEVLRTRPHLSREEIGSDLEVQPFNWENAKGYLGLEEMNCRHLDFSATLSRMQEDAERVKTSKKKVVTISAKDVPDPYPTWFQWEELPPEGN